MSTSSVAHYVRQYWFTDGLAELVTGIGFVVYAGLTWAAQVTSPPWNLWLSWAQRASALLILILAKWLVPLLKWRITYPRTGYVAYPKPSPRRQRITLLIAAGVMLVNLAFSAWLLRQGYLTGYLGVLTLVMTGFYLAMGWKQAMPRVLMYILSLGLAGVLGMSVTSPLWRTVALQGGLHLGFLGLAQITGGAWALRRYLQQHPTPLMEEEPP